MCIFLKLTYYVNIQKIKNRHRTTFLGWTGGVWKISSYSYLVGRRTSSCPSDHDPDKLMDGWMENKCMEKWVNWKNEKSVGKYKRRIEMK